MVDGEKHGSINFSLESEEKGEGKVQGNDGSPFLFFGGDRRPDEWVIRSSLGFWTGCGVGQWTLLMYGK